MCIHWIACSAFIYLHISPILLLFSLCLLWDLSSWKGHLSNSTYNYITILHRITSIGYFINLHPGVWYMLLLCQMYLWLCSKTLLLLVVHLLVTHSIDESPVHLANPETLQRFSPILRHSNSSHQFKISPIALTNPKSLQWLSPIQSLSNGSHQSRVSPMALTNPETLQWLSPIQRHSNGSHQSRDTPMALTNPETLQWLSPIQRLSNGSHQSRDSPMALTNLETLQWLSPI